MNSLAEDSITRATLLYAVRVAFKLEARPFYLDKSYANTVHIRHERPIHQTPRFAAFY